MPPTEHEELLLAKARFEQAFQTSLIGQTIMDFAGARLMTNDAMLQMFGYSEEQWKTLRMREIFHPEELKTDLAAFERLRQGQATSYRRRTRVMHSTGRTVWIDANVAVMQRNADLSGEVIWQARDITDRIEHEGRLQRLADHDHLTTLFNRRVFDQQLRGHASGVRLGRRPPTGSLLLIDLDNFKHHNDSYGHAVGDALLVAISFALRERLRDTDLIGRLGGDEFAVLLPDARGAVAEAVAEDLLTHIRDTAAVISPDTKHPVTASIGIADFEINLDADAVMLAADRALYDAKAGGRNRWRHQPTGPDARALDLSAQSPVRAALGKYSLVRDVVLHDGIDIALQPVVDLRTMRIHGFEALARGTHPIHGAIPPQDLVGIALRHDLIDELTQQVLTKTIDFARRATEITGHMTFTAINIELEQLNVDRPLVQWLLDLDATTDVGIGLEVTERGGDEWRDDHAAAAALLDARGYRFALDDFGAGFSRLGFLSKRLWHMLKLDARFLRDHSEPNRELLTNLLRLAHDSGMSGLAEGIETIDDHHFALAIGARYGQGYYYARPTSPDLQLEYLRAHGRELVLPVE